MEVYARAKLNLTLDVLGKRPDGYHDLRMVMQSVALADTLRLNEGEGEEVRVRSNLTFLPGGEKNLAVKAALCFYEATGRPDKHVSRLQVRLDIFLIHGCLQLVIDQDHDNIRSLRRLCRRIYFKSLCLSLHPGFGAFIETDDNMTA